MKKNDIAKFAFNRNCGLNFPLSKALISLGVHMFSYDPCKIAKLFG